jgi:hypothetical protein
VWERVKWYLTIELTTFRTFRRHETTIEVMMLKNSKEGGIVTDLCQVGGHVECKKTIAMPNGGTQGVIQHFLRFHPAMNLNIRTLNLTPSKTSFADPCSSLTSRTTSAYTECADINRPEGVPTKTISGARLRQD